MELEAFLEPVNNSILAEASRQLPATLARSVLPIIPGVTDISNAEILLLGVYAQEKESHWSPNEIRTSLYKLFIPRGIGRVADLGNISSKLTTAEQAKALEFIADFCAKQNKTLIVFSPNQNHTYHLYNGLFKHRSNAGITIIDSTIDMGSIIGEYPAPLFVSKILEDSAIEPKFMSIIGLQSYLTNPLDAELASKMYVEMMRLGELRTDIKAAEPLIRDANLVSMDMAAIRYADNPDVKNVGPNGLYAEEACMLARYAGFADKVDLFTVFGDIYHQTPQQISTQLTAQLIWHFLDGCANRKQENPTLSTKKFQKFIVKLGKDDEELIFYKSKQTDRWWMEVVYDKDKKNRLVISCRYDDYQQACQQEVPYRWLWYYKK